MSHIVRHNFFGLKLNGESGNSIRKTFATYTENVYTTQNENNLELDNPCYALFCVVSIKITLTEQDITH